MNSRDAILERIRAALAGDPPVEHQPPTPEVWPRENPSSELMVERFVRELETIGGEVVRSRSIDEAAAKLVELVGAAGWRTIGGLDRPLCRQLAARLGEDRVQWDSDEADPKRMADLDLGLVEADYLLADTGTAMVACPTPRDRLMCYLPPASIVVARTDRLVEHMPAAWDEIARRSADPSLRGEFVFITGP